jgi:hypothetical protein
MGEGKASGPDFGAGERFRSGCSAERFNAERRRDLSPLSGPLSTEAVWKLGEILQTIVECALVGRQDQAAVLTMGRAC